MACLLAHLAYLVAYTLLAALILAVLWPGVPAGLRAPVVAYVLCLAAMAAQAAVRWQVLRGRADAPWRNAPRCWPSTASTRRCRRRPCGC